LFSRSKSIQRQLLSGSALEIVSSPLANKRSPVRTSVVDPVHHIGPAPFWALV
jgi:hypothetical protein